MAANDIQYVLTLKDNFNSVIKEADANTNKLENSLGSLNNGMGGIGRAIAAAFSVTAVLAFGASVISAGTKVENARTGLTTLLKDSDEAGRVIKNTMQDAMTTPFAFEGLLAANKALISADETADGARSSVLNLANAIAATGGGNDELTRMVVNLQQIKNVGFASALDIKQFAYAGVNIYKALADSGIKVVKGNRDQKITYEQITMALDKAHKSGGIYANGLENLANNTSVQISNLGDRVFQFSVRIFDKMKPAIDIVILGLSNVIGWMTQFGSWMFSGSTGAKVFGLAMSVLGGALLAYTVILGFVATWTGIVTVATALWNAVLSANTISLVIIAIAAMVAGIIYAYENFAYFRASIWSTWAVIKEFGSIVESVFTALAVSLHGVFTLNPSEIAIGLNAATDAVKDSGLRLATAAKFGWAQGMADFGAENKSTSKGLVPNGVKPKSTAGSELAPKEVKTKGTGSKSVTINVSIKDLIGTYNSNVTNIKEMSSDIRGQVVAALTSAVNDFQIVAGE